MFPVFICITPMAARTLLFAQNIAPFHIVLQKWNANVLLIDTELLKAKVLNNIIEQKAIEHDPHMTLPK